MQMALRSFVDGLPSVLEFEKLKIMITGKSLFEQYRLECGMDDDDVKAARWYKDGLIDFADWILSQNSGKPIVSGALPGTKARSCSSCQHHIDRWPFKSECSLHGKLANITHAADQCCDDWRQ